MSRVVVLPGVLALLDRYASVDDPVADLRTACLEAIGWLVEPRVPVAVYCEAQHLRLARQLVGGAGGTLLGDTDDAILVIGNGSAKRTEKAPGHFDERAEGFDKAVGQALRDGDSAALASIDTDLAEELWADVEAFRSLGSEIAPSDAEAEVDYDDAPYGVQYWVVRWQCR
ncbi:hypothetical protein ACVW00_002977 [Marmoricola sp. URHA0025 HA25]